jgi:hypothetical protein
MTQHRRLTGSNTVTEGPSEQAGGSALHILEVAA